MFFVSLIGGRKQLAARPVDTRIRANSRKRGGGLTRRGDGGPHALQEYRRSRVLQTDSRAASEVLSPANQKNVVARVATIFLSICWIANLKVRVLGISFIDEQIS